MHWMPRVMLRLSSDSGTGTPCETDLYYAGTCRFMIEIDPIHSVSCSSISEWRRPGASHAEQFCQDIQKKTDQVSVKPMELDQDWAYRTIWCSDQDSQESVQILDSHVVENVPGSWHLSTSLSPRILDASWQLAACKRRRFLQENKPSWQNPSRIWIRRARMWLRDWYSHSTSWILIFQLRIEPIVICNRSHDRWASFCTREYTLGETLGTALPLIDIDVSFCFKFWWSEA